MGQQSLNFFFTDFTVIWKIFLPVFLLLVLIYYYLNFFTYKDHLVSLWCINILMKKIKCIFLDTCMMIFSTNKMYVCVGTYLYSLHFKMQICCPLRKSKIWNLNLQNTFINHNSACCRFSSVLFPSEKFDRRAKWQWDVIPTKLS